MIRWELANCQGVDPDTMFPPSGRQGAAITAQAKAVCRGCTIRQDCLDHALDRGETYGIWGGLTERERKPLRRRRLAERGIEINGVGRPKLGHGTNACYARGCRRPECVEAARAYRLARRGA